MIRNEPSLLVHRVWMQMRNLPVRIWQLKDAQIARLTDPDHIRRMLGCAAFNIAFGTIIYVFCERNIFYYTVLAGQFLSAISICCEIHEDNAPNTGEALRRALSPVIAGIDHRYFRLLQKGTSVDAGQSVEPPRWAEFLVCLTAKKRHRAGLLHCLDEDFQNDLAAGISLRRANRRYWSAALNSIGPQLWAAIKRIGVIGIVADYVRGKLGGA